MGRRRKNATKITVAGYVRVSTEEQAAEGVSLDAQEETLRAYCAMRKLELGALVVDAGVTAGRPLAERDGGTLLLELVERRQVQGVVAVKLDRLFRDACDCLAVTREWDRQGVALHLLDLGGQTIDTTTAMGRMFLTMVAGFAELERNLISERTREAMAHKKAKGLRVGQVPYGKVLGEDGESLVDHPEEQKVIRAVRRLRRNGVSLRAIAERINGRGFRNRAGGVFNHTQVVRMLGHA